MKRIILSNKLILRILRPSDAEPIFNLFNTQREYFSKWLPFVATTHRVDNTAKAIRILSADPKNPTFVILHGRKLIGMVGFKETDFVNSKTEIGYWLSRDFQGQGIMTIAVNSLCHYAFDEMRMNRITIKCAVGNTPSSNIPKRLGFQYEGVERAGELQADGHYSDIEQYSKLRSEHENVEL